jgi:hypothetical protein
MALRASGLRYHWRPLQQLQPGGPGVFHRGRSDVAPYEGYRCWGVTSTQAKAWATFPWPFGLQVFATTLAAVADVLVEGPVMLSVCNLCVHSQTWYQRPW